MPSSAVTSSSHRHSSGEQARGLRALVKQRENSAGIVPEATRICHTIVIAGGKGGVGRSVIALNLAIVLAQRGGQVGLLDASPDFGNIELLCGLNGYWNLSHVIQGGRQLQDVVLNGPGGIQILSGVNGLVDFPMLRPDLSNPVFEQLQAFERKLDWLIVDASGGTALSTRELSLAADDLLIIATPEPTAVAEAYATVKSFSSDKRPRLGLLVNQAESTHQAQQILDRLQQAAHCFLQVDLHRRGFILRDPAVPDSVNNRNPFAIEAPHSVATTALQQLSQRWTRLDTKVGAASFFSRLRERITVRKSQLN